MDRSDRDPGPEAKERVGSLAELAWLFLRLGTTAFGGPAAHIALMEREVVARRGWMSHDEFLDMLGATNLIPGPNSTEMAIHIGWRRAGWAGLVVAGACFILPAAAITLGLAWAYVRYGHRPAAVGLLYGVKPVMLAVVAQAVWRLGRRALKSRATVAAAVLVAPLTAGGADESITLFGAGLAVLMLSRAGATRPGGELASILPMGLVGLGLPAAAAVVPFGLPRLFLFFLKVGSLLFGSGYVLLAFLQADLVERWGWLTEAQLLDAVAIGQLTPGPVFTTATFIGYLLGGMPGAAAATLGIFLPAFAFVAASGPLIPRLRRSPSAGAFLDGVNAASLALMAVAAWRLGSSALVDPPTIAVALVSLAILIRTDLNPGWLALAGGLLGLASTSPS